MEDGIYQWRTVYINGGRYISIEAVYINGGRYIPSDNGIES